MIRTGTSIVLVSISFIVTASPFSVFAAEIVADSSINAVTIYPGSAKVTRTAQVALVPGSNQLVINNLPINMNESSLRVSGEGGAEVTLGSVELQREISQDVVQQHEKVLRDKIERLQDERKEVSDALARNRQQLGFIRTMVLGGGPVTPQPSPKVNSNHDAENDGTYIHLPLEQWQQAWQILDSATADTQQKIRAANKSLKQHDEQIKTLNRKLQQVAVNQRETLTAKLNIESRKATELLLKLSYQISGARWVPVYDADLDTKTGKIQLKTLAQISQRTGEDWKNVNVALSTLRPGAGSQLPGLNTWTIDFMPDIAPMPQSRGFGMSSKGVASEAEMMAPMMQDKAFARKSRPARMKQQQAPLLSTDFSAEYSVPGVVSLNSGSNKRQFALSVQTITSALHLASVPRLDPRAMILAKFKYNRETPLLAGNLSLYRNGSYVGNTFLQQRLSGEEVKLSFGEDDKVKIKFQPDPDKKRKDGILFGKRKVIERHYQLSINSNHDKPYDITLYDIFPVAANNEIKVDYTGEKPGKDNIEDKKGVFAWERTLYPGKEIKLKYGYVVSYPDDRHLQGL